MSSVSATAAGEPVSVAMIGLGRMGLPMARHMAAAGHRVMAFDTSSEAREAAVEVARANGLDRGSFTVSTSARQFVDDVGGRGIQLVCSSLPATEHVEQAYFGPYGMAHRLASGTVCADLSTISIDASRSLATRCRSLGLPFLDAPVSGTSIHAEDGTLVVMVGGDAKAAAMARPVLQSFAQRVERVGGNGTGLQLKLITNRLLTTHLAALAEAIVSLEQTDLAMEQGLELLRAGAVPRLLDYKSRPLARRDHQPLFTVDLMAKDLRLADEGLPATPLASAGRELVEAAAQAGFGGDDLTAIIEIVESRFHDSLLDGGASQRPRT